MTCRGQDVVFCGFQVALTHLLLSDAHRTLDLGVHILYWSLGGWNMSRKIKYKAKNTSVKIYEKMHIS